jgi:hypothetical protein
MSEQRIEKSKAAVEAADHIPAEEEGGTVGIACEAKTGDRQSFANP